MGAQSRTDAENTGGETPAPPAESVPEERQEVSVPTPAHRPPARPREDRRPLTSGDRGGVGNGNDRPRAPQEVVQQQPSSQSLLSPYQRIAVLVDVQNLFYSAKHQYQAKVDFGKLLQLIVGRRQLIRAICYIVETQEIDQSGFINVLRSKGYEVKSKALRLRPDGSAKGDWDMGIAIDAFGLCNRVDGIVLVSGDGDFVDLIRMLNVNGCLTEVASFPSNTAEDLKQAVVRYMPLDSGVLIAPAKPKI